MFRTAAIFPFSIFRSRVVVVTAAIAIVAVALAIATPPSRSGKTSGTAPSTVANDPGAPSLGQPGGTVAKSVPGGMGESLSSGDAAKSVGGTSMGRSSQAASVSADAAQETDVAVPNVGGTTTVTLDEKIARTAAMELRVKRGSFNDAWLQATQVATAAGGSVTSSSTSNIGNAARTGTMTLRVPSDHFQRALDGLSGVGKVRSLSTGSQDATQEYVDASSRLRHDRAVERRLLTLLAKTTTVSETLAVQNRLDSLQSQIEVEVGRIQYLTTITSFSTIDLTIAESGRHVAKQTHRAHPSALGQAWTSAIDRFTANVARGIVWLGGALPLLLLAAAVVLGARFVIGRRSAAAAE